MFPLMNRNVPHVEQKILSYLDEYDLTMAAFVCRKWYMATRKMTRHAILIRAVETGCEHLIAYILDDPKVDVNEQWFPDAGGTALYHAIIREQSKIVRLLLRRRDIDVNVSKFETPLLSAASMGNIEILRLLLNREDIDINMTHGHGGRNALIYAIINGHDNIAKILLGRKDIDVNARDNGGHTPLMMAVMMGNCALVKILLKRKDVDVNAINRLGNS